MRKAATPLKLLIAGVVILVATVLALVQIRSSDYLLLPDPAHPAAPLVTVQGGHDRAGAGGIYFVDVLERQASVLEKLIPPLRGDGASLVKPTAVIPPGANAEVARRVAQAQMTTSQQFAAAVALRSLGYPVTARASGVVVDAVVPESNANGKIVPGDVVVGVDGKPTLTIESLLTAIRSHRVGDVVNVRFRREGATHQVPVKLTRAAPGSPIPVVGLSQLEQAATVKLPRRVRIKAGRVGGPSAGLAFALQIRDELGRDVTRGNRVVATGAIGLAGDVEPVGGIKQKTFGARKAHADVFLVPAGSNAREARRYASGLRIIPVRTYTQALRALARLPRRR